MRINNAAKVAAIALLVSGSLSCNKEIAVSPNVPIAGKSGSKDIQAHYSFDWDNPSTTTMPVSARLNSPAVSVPWRSNGGLPLDPGIVNDYHRADGWSLVYCSFSPDDFPNPGNNGVVATASNLPAGGLYFALYNRFRGIIRYYLYVPPQSYGFSTQISHGLKVYSGSNTTRALNFEKGEISDPAAGLSNGQGFTKTSKDGLPTTGGWYAMQYQIAYDPAITGSNYINPSFIWDTYSISVSQIQLNGTEVGTSRGTIQNPAADSDLSNIILNGGLAVAEVFAGGYTGGLATAFASGVAGNTTSFLSGIFGQTSGGDQTVDLKLNANITTTGTANSMSLYQTNAMPFPTQNIAGSNAVPPLLTTPMGLFNLSKRPYINTNLVKNSDGSLSYSYTIRDNIERDLFQLNPSLSPTVAGNNGATYSDFKTEIVLYTSRTQLVSGQSEIIGNNVYLTGVNSISVKDAGRGHRLYMAAVRVSFNVVPSNTSVPKQHIVQTFYADAADISSPPNFGG